MKKILKTNWERYKNSPEGKEVIEMFNHLTTPEATPEDMYEVIKRFDPEYTRNSSKKEEKRMIEMIHTYDNFICKSFPQKEEELNDFSFGDYYLWLTHCMAIGIEDEETTIDNAPQSYFKRILGLNTLLSIALYANDPFDYFPNLFCMQFAYFTKFAEKYELEFPDIPNRSDYRMRWCYYLEMCNIIHQFADENDIQDPGELCAFLFDYELTNIKEEMEEEHNNPMPSVPEQAWILVGNYSEGEKAMKEGFWQSNQFTKKGDIMLFYEKSPVKKLNSIWTALEDGFVDPFGHYYSFTVIGNKIEIPDDMAITFEEFKNNDYFKKENRGSEGNYVSKNFQDVSGWQVTYDDYAEIKRMLAAKGFDTSVMPSLYEPGGIPEVEIKDEKDVENYLIKPLLEEMGWKYKEKNGYDQQVPFQAGHGQIKRPDFCLHITQKDGQISAKVVIEAKFLMSNIQQMKEDFNQGISYAKYGNAQIFILCDRHQIRVYERNKKGEFGGFESAKRYLWSKKREWYNELKRILDI